MKNPLVSVVVPSYNHDRFLVQCIDSILNQTYKNYELIVIDDGSTDKSAEILKKLQQKHSFKLIFQENIGVASTFNKALKNHVNGKYFTFCASDDFWLKDKLKIQVDYLEKHQQIPMCYGKSIAINSENVENPKYTEVINRNLKGGDIFKDIIYGNFHPPVNYMIKTQTIKDLGLYNPEIHTEDFYMNLKISSKFHIGYIDEYLSYYRIFETEKKRLSFKIFNAKLKCIQDYSHSMFYKRAIRLLYFNTFVEYSSYTKYKAFALRCLLQSGDVVFKKMLIKGLLKFFLFWK